jgi:molybdate transport system permease protein
VNLLTDMEREALLLSLDVALRSVVCSLPLALAVAWLLTRRRIPGRLLLDSLVHLPSCATGGGRIRTAAAARRTRP